MAASASYQPLAVDDANSGEYLELRQAGPERDSRWFAWGRPRASLKLGDKDEEDKGQTWTFLRRVSEWLMRWTLVVKCVDFVRTNAGLLLVASSQFFFALMNVAVKKLSSLDPPVPPLELVVVRMAITYICCVTYLLWRNVPDPILGPKGVRHLLAIRGFTGFFGLFGIYYSLQYLSLSDATVLTFLAPLTTAISGYFFLGESFHRKEAAAGVLSLLGVILIARPAALFGSHAASPAPRPDDGSDLSENGSPDQRLIAVGLALIGVLGATGAYTSIRAIGKRAHTLHSMSYFSLWCVLTGSVGMIILEQPFVFPRRIEWLALLVMIGIFGFLAQALLTMGLQRETAGRGALALYVQIIFASILERIFFHVVPSFLSILGTLIIMGSAIYVAVTKNTSKSSSQDPGNALGEGESDEDIRIVDLELGVAEPERTHFLGGGAGLGGIRGGRVNGSAVSLRSMIPATETVEEGDEKLHSNNNVERGPAEATIIASPGTTESDAVTLFEVADSDSDSDFGSGSGSRSDSRSRSCSRSGSKLDKRDKLHL